MKLRIKETNEIEELTLIDPKTGCCWLSDAMAGDDNISYNDDTEENECDQEAYDWWSDFITSYEEADNRWHELYTNASGSKYDEMIDEHANLGVEFNDMPRALNELCEKWENKLFLIISEGSCNDEEEAFEAWMNDNHPEIETCIKNTTNGGLFNIHDERVEREIYWDLYCKKSDTEK